MCTPCIKTWSFTSGMILFCFLTSAEFSSAINLEFKNIGIGDARNTKKNSYRIHCLNPIVYIKFVIVFTNVHMASQFNYIYMCVLYTVYVHYTHTNIIYKMYFSFKHKNPKLQFHSCHETWINVTKRSVNSLLPNAIHSFFR